MVARFSTVERPDAGADRNNVAVNATPSAAGPSGAAQRARDRRRATWSHDLRCRRRISSELDAVSGTVRERRPVDPAVDWYGDVTSLNLGVAERERAALKLREAAA